MDLDIEMDVDDIHEAPAPAIPAAYTEDLTGEDQVRAESCYPGFARRNALTPTRD